jgi:hypothetical protein
MLDRIFGQRRRAGTLFLALVIAVTGAVATTGTAAAAAPNAIVPIPVASGTLPANGFHLTAAQQASWNAKLPALKAGLARGESLAVALQQVGLPAITVGAVSGSTATGGIQPMGASCQDWTCGWEFDAYSSYEIEWLVWAGVISGPGLICAYLGPVTFGTACTVSGLIWGIVSAYFTYSSPPRWSGRCIYIGIGFGRVAKWEQC